MSRYDKKTTSQLIKIATRNFNKMVRLRDSQNGAFQCISCGKVKSTDKMNAGHFWPTTKSATRFDPDNVHGQCVKCNHFLSGNLAEYQPRLIQKIGQYRFDQLQVQAYQVKKWDRIELIEIIKDSLSKITIYEQKS